MIRNPNDPATVLIVDDYASHVDMLRDFLEYAGYKVLAEDDGEAGYQRALKARPDIILLDIMMPGVDGLEACRRLKENPATQAIPVIFMTGVNKLERKVEGFQVGAIDYITKPFQPAEVLARLHTHLELKRLHRKLEKHNELLETRVRERTADLERLNRAYRRFLPEQFLAFLEKNSVVDLELGDHVETDMTVLFGDLHGWTGLSERLSTTRAFELINRFYGAVSPIVRQHGGFVDQYYGDGVMALFPGHSDAALHAAVEMHRAMDTADIDDLLPADERLRFSVGIHSGLLAIGIIGEDERLQPAVVSDVVNLAARLESLCRRYDARILISEEAFERVVAEGSRVRTRFLERVRAKGKKEPVGVVEVFEADEPERSALKERTAARFAEGIANFYQRRFTDSIVAFKEVLGVNEDDRTAKLYVERCAELILNEPETEWTGVLGLNEK